MRLMARADATARHQQAVHMLWQQAAVWNLIWTAGFRLALLRFVMADGLAAAGGVVDVDAEIRVKYNGVRELRAFDTILFLRSAQ